MGLILLGPAIAGGTGPEAGATTLLGAPGEAAPLALGSASPVGTGNPTAKGNPAAKGDPKATGDGTERDRRAAVNRLERQLREARPERRRRAVAGLAELGGDRALARVVEALADRSAEVADEAQLRLPGLLGADLLERVRRGKGLTTGPPLVRLRWAELMGRGVAPQDAKGLGGLLGVRGAAERRLLLWSVERLGRRGLIAGERGRLVERVLGLTRRGREPGVRAAALQALLPLAPGRAEPLIRAWIGGEVRELCCSALMAAMELDLPDRTRLLGAALDHGDWGVRLRAIELAREETSPVVLDLLVARLREEPRAALRAAVVVTLRRLTGLRYRDQPDAWEAALRTLAPGGALPRLASTSSSGDRDTAARGTVAALGRLDPMSDRLAILIDFSGSLWFKNAEGHSKKDRLDPQVTRLLSGFDPEVRFMLVPYTHEPHPFERELVGASRRNIRRAQRFFEAARMNGSGDLYGALSLALDTPEVDRVMLLTDGAPSGGERWNIELMVPHLQERLRFRPALLDFILVDSPRKLERGWGQLAESTGGRLIRLSW